MEQPELSKAAALAQLQARASLGRQLLARVLKTEAELDAASAARVEWALANKKLLHQILGDAAAQVRFAHHAGNDDGMLRPSLEARVREFQQQVIDQVADMERLIQAFKRMATPQSDP